MSRLETGGGAGRREADAIFFGFAYAVLTDLQRAGTAIYALTLPWIDLSKARVLDAYMDVFRARLSIRSLVDEGREFRRCQKLYAIVLPAFAAPFGFF